MFEDNQKDLEMAVEALSEMFEKPVTELKHLSDWSSVVGIVQREFAAPIAAGHGRTHFHWVP